MNDQKAIHETIIKDIVDLIKEIKDTDSINAMIGRGKSIKSIASASTGLTMVFPVLCSDSIEIENAAMISKAIERKATTMMNLILVANQTTECKTVDEYMKNFHTNLKVNDDITVDGMIDLLDSIALKEDTEIYNKMTNKDKRNLIEDDMKEINHTTLKDNINNVSVGDYQILPGNDDNPIIITDQSSITEEDNYKRAILGADFRIKNNLKDDDVRKANELIPTTLQVNYTYTAHGKDGNPVPISSSALIGIKAKLYKMESVDVVERLADKSRNRNGFNKFIRATTREISFFRDFLFAIDQAKIDALSASSRGSTSKMWKVLERRSTKSKLRRRLGMINDAVAITTLVISQEEVEFIKKEFSVDLEKENIIRPILEEYNLMGFAIIDDTNEVAKFIFDTGDDLYEHLSFKSLERESNDQNYKRVVNLLSKVAN